MRGMASASKTLALSFIGYGLGGALIGMLSDIFGAGDAAMGLQMALVVVSATYLIAGALFVMSTGTFERDYDNAQLASGVA